MTKRDLTSEGKIATLRARLGLTLRFIQDVQDFPSGKEMHDLVKAAAAKGDLRTLRLLAKEIDAMTVALVPHERDGLEALLLARLGVDKEEERAKLKRNVAKVLARGTIASEKERQRLEEYVDVLEAMDGDSAEIESVRRLIASP